MLLIFFELVLAIRKLNDRYTTLSNKFNIYIISGNVGFAEVETCKSSGKSQMNYEINMFLFN